MTTSPSPSAPVARRPMGLLRVIPQVVATVSPLAWLVLVAISSAWSVFVAVGTVMTGGFIVATALSVWAWVLVRDPDDPPGWHAGSDAWFSPAVAAGHIAISHVLFIILAPIAGFLVVMAQRMVSSATDSVPTWQVALVAMVFIVPVEELAWRGLVQPRFARVSAQLDPGGGQRRRLGANDNEWAAIVATTVLFCLFQLFTGNLALVGAALLGGFTWGWLQVRSGGLLAPVLAHSLWTGAMTMAPPV